MCQNWPRVAKHRARSDLNVTLTAGMFKHADNNFRSNHAAHTTAKRNLQQQQKTFKFSLF
jgi:hypothetical protein